MKLSVFVAVSALVLAGVAAAAPVSDPGAGVSYGANNTPPPDPRAMSSNLGDPLPPYVDARTRAEQGAAYSRIVATFNAACASEREALCKGKKYDDDARRCLTFRAAKLSPTCKAAAYQYAAFTPPR